MPNQLTAVLCYLRHTAGTKMCDQQGDAQLIQKFVAQRNEDAFAVLLQRHGPMVFAVCRQVLGNAHDAEDAFQATFLVLARQARSIRKPEALAAWLHRVAVNLARTAKANTAQRQTHERQTVLMSPANPADEVELADAQSLIQEEVDRLPEKYRVPIVCCYLEGKTHEEVARQLGWPVGTVKGRLSRARQLLRTRLSRRGLVLSGGAVAAALTQSAAMGQVPIAVLGHTLKAALSFAGEGTIAAGIVSPQALALAKGVLHTMTATKLASTFVTMLAIGVFGLAIGVIGFAASFQPGKDGDVKPDDLAAPLPGRTAVDFGPEVKGLRARITLAKEKLEVGEPIPVKYVVKNVSKEEQILWNCGFWGNHLVIVHSADGKEPPLTAEGQFRRQMFGGPRLRNAPYKVPAGGEDMAYLAYDLTKYYDLSRPRRYTVHYIYEEKDEGVPPKGGWEGRLISNTAAFEVVARADDKNSVEKDGARFEILVPEHAWSLPEKPGGKTSIKLRLRISNRTDKPLRFSRFDTLFPEAVGPNGNALTRSGGRDHTRPMMESDCPLVQPGDSTTFDIDAHLFWQAGKLRFGGSDGFGGIWGFADEFKLGQYRLRIWYHNTATEHEVGRGERTILKGIWTGEVKTPFVELSLATPAPQQEKKKDNALTESQPVRVEGLEFVAVVPKQIPSWGGPRDVAVGLRVTNVSDKPLTLSVFDVIRFWLIDPADGKKWGADMGRDGLPKPLPPVTLAPGASWTWQPRAKLDRTTDRATLRLSGPDGLGVAGFWTFTTLTAPKYRLAIEYGNSNPKQGDVPLWVGKATTKEVEFELVKDDLGKLQGTWHLVAAEEGGMAIPPQNFGRNTHWVFSGSTGTSTSGKRVFVGTVTLDEAKSPKWIDVSVGKSIVLRGIYELNGDTLRLFLAPSGAERPAEFRTKQGEQRSIGTYERAKGEIP
jgi:RNA polymerase sigma factor (sigma-70 family)